MNTNIYPVNSRYYGIDTAQMTLSNGRRVIYQKRRFVPSPSRFALLMQYGVVDGSRLDRIANQFLGDPELFWRLADANGAMRPEELTETVGRQLRITLPEGIPGARNA